MSRSAKIESLKAVLENPPQVRHPLACVHLGEPTGETVACPSCRGSVQVKILSCAKHGRATVAKSLPDTACCANCRDYTRPASDFQPITVRNLLYYVYPVAGNGVWQTCVDQMAERIALFNGKIVLCVAQDPKSGRKRPYGVIDGPREGKTTDSTAEVESRLKSHPGANGANIEILEVENNPDLWESAHHNLLFGKVFNLNPNEATLYGHAKGVTRPQWHIAHHWRDVLVKTLVDWWPQVEASLKDHPVTGSFKKVGRGWPKRESNSLWHYSGSWFWFRNAALFAKNWQRIDKFWAAIESYPSIHFRRSEAGCVFHENSVRRMNLYDRDYWSLVDSEELRVSMDKMSIC